MFTIVLTSLYICTHEGIQASVTILLEIPLEILPELLVETMSNHK